MSSLVAGMFYGTSEIITVGSVWYFTKKTKMNPGEYVVEYLSLDGVGLRRKDGKPIYKTKDHALKRHIGGTFYPTFLTENFLKKPDMPKVQYRREGGCSCFPFIHKYDTRSIHSINKQKYSLYCFCGKEKEFTLNYGDFVFSPEIKCFLEF